MNRVPIGKVIEVSRTLTFNFTKTRRGENYKISSGGLTMDLNGALWGTPGPVVTIIGGDSRHVFAKKDEENTEYYMTEFQKSTLNSLCYQLAMSYPNEGRILDGNSTFLNYMATNAFENYRH